MSIEAIKKLAEIVNSEKRHICADRKIELHEKSSAPLNHVLIGGVENDVVAIQLDKLGFADKVFENGYSARRACDALIFCHLDNQAYILILDLKSSIPSDENHIPQLVSGDCFADYLLSVLQRFEQIEISSAWQRRYFIFHCANNKRTTLPDYAKNPPDNSQANNAHILCVKNGEIVPLRKLLHKPL